jgi:HAMP domain-containing protein
VEEPAVANALYWLSWMSLLRNIAAALLVVGAALAFAEGWISEPWRKTVDDARTIEIARLSTSLETARAEIAAANAREKEAELKLEQLRNLAGPRDINFDVFHKELEGKPKAHVQIWYLPDSSDGYWFASRLRGALGIAGWDVESPTSIPEPDQRNMLVRDMPRTMAAGGQPSGVTIVGSNMQESPVEGTPFHALMDALAKSAQLGLGHVYGAGGSQFMPVPQGTLRVIVAAKSDPMFAPAPAPVDANPAK